MTGPYVPSGAHAPGPDWSPGSPPALHPAYRPLASDGLPAVPRSTELRHVMPPGARAGRRRPVRLAFFVLGLLLLAACALTIMWLIGQETGRTGFLLGAVLATLPVPLLIAAFRWLDRYEPEPVRLLLLTFAWGAAVATLAAITLNSYGAMVFFAGPDDSISNQAAVFLAPPVEELAKGAILLVLALRRRLDGILDGIVLAGFVGVGFAFTENILYYGRAYAEQPDAGTGVLLSLVVFVVRGVVSPFAHPLFTLPIGIGLGIAVRSRRRSVKIVAPLLGYAVAMVLHGTWNGMAVRTAETFNFSYLAIGYLAIMLPAFAAGIALAVWFRRREGRVLGRRLPAFAEAGWIAPHEVAVVASLRLRQLALDLARHLGGKDARRATGAYHRHLIGLAFLRERLASGHRLEEGLTSLDRMLSALPALRAVAVVPPPPQWIPPASTWAGAPPGPGQRGTAPTSWPGPPPPWAGGPPPAAPSPPLWVTPPSPGPPPQPWVGPTSGTYPPGHPGQRGPDRPT